MKAPDRFCTDTPVRCTASGRNGSARFTRFCTSTCASSGLVPISKYAVIVVFPDELDDDSMYSMLSAPLICCSIGDATLVATTSADAPGYDADTETDTGVMSGYCATGSFPIPPAPGVVMTIEMTDAKIGRSMQYREMLISASLASSSLPARPRRAAPHDPR